MGWYRQRRLNLPAILHPGTRVLILVALAGVPASEAVAQIPCARWGAAAIEGLKDLAIATYGSPTDNSAVREQVRAQEAGNAIDRIHANLDQAHRFGCPPTEIVISPLVYEREVRLCLLATAAARQDRCDREKWAARMAPPDPGPTSRPPGE